VTCDRAVVSSANKTDRHDIIEMLLTVELNAINHHKPKGVYVAKRKSFFVEKTNLSFHSEGMFG
jgi:hypothetical protein